MSARRPLQNRVDPFGELVATPARGMLLGNRGGKFHRDDQSLGRRRWASKQWIACVCAFKGRRRAVWAVGYTQLFFLDEVTALAAGHRPCFECRRAEAEAFRAFFGGARRLSAPQMDAILHAERREGRGKRLWESAFAQLPDGAMVALEGRAYAIRGDALLPWSFDGYGAPRRRPGEGAAPVLTPASIVSAIAAGYRPRWAASTP
ncbi:hypothetical protein [Methylocapsa sp. S129]|uniref:hypothetical protein n=1 Tax=Methylocapsa sp. S129 TaxID=1641869 RepID=UPI00131D180F|nr:hypothetical protein [Methylocapsa sp. S129]